MPEPRTPTAGLLAAAIGLLAAPAGGAEELVVRRQAFVSTFLLTGELVAERADYLIGPNAGVWPLELRWIADDGSEVEPGEVVAEFDNSQLAANLDELEQAVVEARSRLESLEAEGRTSELAAELEVATKEAELEKRRLGAEVPANLLAAKDYEERQLALETARIELDEARRALALTRQASRAKVERQRVELSKAEAAARRAHEGLELLELRAPRAGVVLVADHYREGRTYRSGDTTWPGMTVATIPDLSSLVVDARLFDVDDGRIESGMVVSARLDAFPESTWTGRVERIEPIADEVGRDSTRRAFRVRVHLDDLEAAILRPGMSVQIAVERRLEDRLLVPRAAIAWTAAADGLRATVRRPGGDPVAIEAGPCSPRACVVAAGALDDGEPLLPAGSAP